MQGLITYMRSDSTRLSDLFVKDTLAYIQDEYGKEYVGKAHTKNKANTQDAHEAIRPTDIKNTPESIKQYLTNDQYRSHSAARNDAYRKKSQTGRENHSKARVSQSRRFNQGQSREGDA